MAGSKPQPVEPRFWAKVKKSDGCWEWTATRNAPGWYGTISINGRMTLAHRVSWELHYGPIPDGMLVLHSCDNGGCVRPDHLMLGTHKANSVDAARKGRLGQTKHKRACTNGHPYTEDNTYRSPTTGRRQCRVCRRDADKRKYERHAGRINAKRRRASAQARGSGSCAYCGRVFELWRTDVRYCSKACRTEASWKRYIARHLTESGKREAMGRLDELRKETG